eukprot:GHVN01057007.1.p2 GENE.GHVN01057007.1~~GHVN01057007.1.p2  ORF type:complete len:195 (-),score=26.31 GHVN01057007.1:364-948(-)
MENNTGKVSYVISQNVDSLHVMSGLPHTSLSETHGNLFIERCLKCRRRYHRGHAIQTLDFKPTGRLCSLCHFPPHPKAQLTDVLLDWDSTYEEHFRLNSIAASKAADLHICLGTSCHMQPAGSFPLLSRQAKVKKSKVAMQEVEVGTNMEEAETPLGVPVDGECLSASNKQVESKKGKRRFQKQKGRMYRYNLR